MPGWIAVDHAGDPGRGAGLRPKAERELLDSFAGRAHRREQQHDDQRLPPPLVQPQPYDEAPRDDEERNVRRLGQDLPDQRVDWPAVHEGEQRLVERKDDPGSDGDGKQREAKDCQKRDDQPGGAGFAGSGSAPLSVAAHVEPLGAPGSFRARTSRSICKRMR